MYSPHPVVYASYCVSVKAASKSEKGGWTVTNGGGRGSQEAIPDPAWQPNGKPGRRAGTVFPDITAEKNGITIRIQTVDVRAGGTPASREISNLNKILQRKPGNPVYWFPKGME